ncbi:PTS sugar transporter subunit IIA [Dolosicoccus paucivorans]
MLSKLINQDTIQIVDFVDDWKKAIQLSAQLLLDREVIEPRYIDAMINRAEELGPFFHLGSGIALPHARPEDGVNEVGLSLLKVKEPVLLLDDESHPIKVFITLASPDNETHLEALSSLTQILMDKEKLNALLEAETSQEIEDILKVEEN